MSGAKYSLVAILLCAGPVAATRTLPTLNFFAWGDWGHNVPANVSLAGGGSGKDYEEQIVANQVTNYTKQLNPRFYIVLGDNFYQSGPVNTTDPLWNQYYQSVYTDPVTFVPWYGIFGNHDYYQPGQPQAQIDYYKQSVDGRWTFPDYQYSRIWNLPSSKKTMQIVFINTVTLCPESRATTIGFPANPNNTYPNLSPTGARSDQLIRQPTLQWIENQIKSSRADFLIVAGHYHIYSVGIGALQSPENRCLIDQLDPLLQKYGVDVYLNGHVHDLEHWLVNGTHYLTIGHGSDVNSPPDPVYLNGGPYPANYPPIQDLLFQRTVGSFGAFEVSDSSINFQYIHEDGTIIYNYTIPFNINNKKKRGIPIQY